MTVGALPRLRCTGNTHTWIISTAAEQLHYNIWFFDKSQRCKSANTLLAPQIGQILGPIHPSWWPRGRFRLKAGLNQALYLSKWTVMENLAETCNSQWERANQEASPTGCSSSLHYPCSQLTRKLYSQLTSSLCCKMYKPCWFHILSQTSSNFYCFVCLFVLTAKQHTSCCYVTTTVHLYVCFALKSHYSTVSTVNIKW